MLRKIRNTLTLITLLRAGMANIKLESRKAANLAYIEHQGPYDSVPWEGYIERLYGWAKEQKVMPGFYPMGIYFDEPEKTPPEQCRSHIGITFKGRAKERAGVKTRKMPIMKVAAISHKGPSSEFKNTYAALTEWIGKKGFKVSGPAIEVYSKKPEVVGGVTILYAKVMMPVTKK
jgi:AraC family transcriptional regulator